MKVTKRELRDKIETLVSNGVANMEEVDVTAGKIADLVFPLIDYYQSKEPPEPPKDREIHLSGQSRHKR